MDSLRVAVDATSLYGPRTGVGRFTAELLDHMAGTDGLQIVAFAVTWRGREQLADLVPAGVSTARGAMAAAPLRALWRRAEGPESSAGQAPSTSSTARTTWCRHPAAPRLASIHDLTFIHHPEMCTADVLQYPGLVRRALDRGAWVHTISDFVRNEVIDLLGADPDRVVTVPPGVNPAPLGDRDPRFRASR